MDEHGFIARSFSRRYPLPADIIMEEFDDKVMCELSSDGVLTVTVPRPVPAIKGGAENGMDAGKVSGSNKALILTRKNFKYFQVVPIKQTGHPHQQ